MVALAEKGAALAEESYRILQAKFNHAVLRRIPLIFYSTHLHFEQTNITPGFIPEGVGGFFEFFKGRVVIPGNGDLNQFRHVIRHELVHVFMHDKLSTLSQRYDRFNMPYPPLWFVEGLAEFWSTTWDAKAEMVLKDAVLNNYMVGLEEMYRINGTFTMYKVGQNILMYIAKTYGADKVLAIMENLWRFNSFQESFEYTLGEDYRQFDQKYLLHLKKKYYPLLKDQQFSVVRDQTVVRDGYNFKPCYYRENNQDYVVFVGNRTGYSSIYLKRLEATPLDEKEKVETLIKGEASSDFEAFHIFDSRISVTAKGMLAFSAKSGETDALYLYDIPQRRTVSKILFPNIVAIYSPSWAPDGKRLVFSGLDKSGQNDLYLYNIEDSVLTRLTDDFYADMDPVFSPDGKFIAFSSDRTDFGTNGAKNIFLMSLHNGRIFYLTYGREQDVAPAFSPDGRALVFASDRSGTSNIYLLDDPLGQIHRDEPASFRRITNFVGSVFDPCWTSSGGLLYGVFENSRFQIRFKPAVLPDTLPEIQQPIKPLLEKPWSIAGIESAKIESRKPYIKKFDLDFAQAQVSQDPIFGTNGGAQFAFTDMLSNDQYYLLIFNNAQTTGDFWKSFNFMATKVSLEKRINYALGIYRFAGYYYNPADAYYYEESVGAIATIIYPFSQFSRLSFSQNFSYSDKDWFFSKRRQAYLNSSYISYVFDNALYGPTGPMDGQRLNVTFGNTYDFYFSRVNYLTGMIDLRKYFRLSLRNAYAIRLFYLFSEGAEARQFYFGGSWDLRLYPRWRMHGRRIFLFSQELRFPLIDRLGIRLPLGSISFNSIRGALFVDAGNAWNDTWDGLKGSFGLGVRVRVGGFLVLRYDIGRRTDFKTLSGRTYSQFFFGWDF